MKIRRFSLSAWFTGVVVALLPALAFGQEGQNQSVAQGTVERDAVEHGAAAESKPSSKPSEAADVAKSREQFEHAERTQSTTRQTGLGADAQQGINPAEVEKTFGKQVGVVDLSSLTPDQSRALQQVLSDRGYYRGKVDGVIGTETRNAVSKLLARQFALNQRFVRQGKVTEPFLAGLGVQANELAPVSGTDASHVRPQAISPAGTEAPPVKHGGRKRPRNDKSPALTDGSSAGTKAESGEADSHGASSTSGSGANSTSGSSASGSAGSSGDHTPGSSTDPLSNYWDQQG